MSVANDAPASRLKSTIAELPVAFLAGVACGLSMSDARTRLEPIERSRLAEISIVAVGSGNIASISKAISDIGGSPIVAADHRAVRNADKLILPGIGHFDAAMARLKELGFADALNEAVLMRQRPVLGICLGLHLMASGSDEGQAHGLGWIGARALRFHVSDWRSNKVPHIGWNTVETAGDPKLMSDISNQDEFYFSHSYHLEGLTGASGSTTYEYPFASVVEIGNIFGTQFHPEKSYRAGLQLLKNFSRS